MTLLPGARHGPVGIFDGIIDCSMRCVLSTLAGNSALSIVAALTGALPSMLKVMKWFCHADNLPAVSTDAFSAWKPPGR